MHRLSWLKKEAASHGIINSINTFIKKIFKRTIPSEFIPNHPYNPEVNYFKNPVHGVVEMKNLMKEVEQTISSITDPLLIMQGSHDPVVAREGADILFKNASSSKKELAVVDAAVHGIVNGQGSTDVFCRVADFLDKWM